ncbi:DUF6504 family protein [Terrabacter sp. LjRoot27]|uniref:DUF6504 family protein n=1 Tax=Terrabacter sp. LjRoot27 TaxID=3342306 RepID=UPI003ECFC208
MQVRVREREQQEQEQSVVGRSDGRVARSTRPPGASGTTGAPGSPVSEPSGSPASPGDGTLEAPPEAFIWRGRLYVVRGVLAQWRERRAWWHDALEADEAQVRPGETLVAAASEQHVWRVEASPGWSFTPGVYDLAHDESPRGDRWSLVRVAD